MGAKTALLAFADGDLPTALRGVTKSSREAAEALVRRVHPGYAVADIGEQQLSYSVHPPNDVTYAVSLPGADVLCDARMALDEPSGLPEHLIEFGSGRRILLHAMHSVVDWAAFAVWENGVLVRSLSLSPGSGIIEDIGEPLPFEKTFRSIEDHPLAVGEEALRALFGFVVEGRYDPSDIDADAIRAHGFRVTDPSGEEQADRDAAYAEIRRRLMAGTLHQNGGRPG